MWEDSGTVWAVGGLVLGRPVPQRSLGDGFLKGLPRVQRAVWSVPSTVMGDVNGSVILEQAPLGAPATSQGRRGGWAAAPRGLASLDGLVVPPYPLAL